MTFDSVGPLIIGLVFASILMVILWLIQIAAHDAGVVDVGWSGTIGLLALYYVTPSTSLASRTFLVTALAGIWSFRLAIHLLRDRVIGKPEDGRYQRLRQRFGRQAQLFFFAFFQVQAILAWLFSIPVWIAMHRPGNFDFWDFAGLLVWIVSITGESVADAQLARFRADGSNRGKTCRKGLWNYSRHPNYFFEWLHWWVYVLIGWQADWGWVTLFAPMLMLFFLFKVTGIPATEAQALASRGDAMAQIIESNSRRGCVTRGSFDALGNRTGRARVASRLLTSNRYPPTAGRTTSP
jgi:steroid 5-alpha reductase family enzyme